MSFIGYARVSTVDQNPSLQIDALGVAGCTRTFTEAASGALADRPQLKAALDYIRPGETLVVWKLDRLTRSLPQLIATIASLEERGCGFKSLTEAIDTTTASGKASIMLSWQPVPGREYRISPASTTPRLSATST